MRGYGLIAGVLAFVASTTATRAASPEVIHRTEHATALVRISDHGKPIAFGTAFCIDKDGLFITNAHVTNGKAEVDLIVDPSGKEQRILKAKVVREDPALDLAELQAEGGGPYSPLPLGKDDALVETQDIIAFGFPFGAAMALDRGGFPSISVNTGHITSLRRKSGALELIQVDALVNPGNSGGPVIDSDGNVVGIIEAGIPGAGVNFAIPISRLDKLLEHPLRKPDAVEAPALEGVKMPVPSAADQATAEKTIEEAYKDELAQPRQADQLALAKTLIEASYALSNTGPERYMMLVKSRDLAAKAGDLQTADIACQELAKNFTVTLAAARLAMLQATVPTLVGQDENTSFVIMALNTVDAALLDDDFAPIEDLLKLATVQLHNTGSRDLGDALAFRRQQFELQHRQFLIVQPAMEKLAAHPDDPDANLAVGKYDCFFRMDWWEGLPMLVKGSDAHLKQLAQNDLSDPEQPDAQAAIADDWLTYSNSASVAGDHIRTRAYYWYLKAEPGLSGPDAKRVQERIDQLQNVASKRWGQADLWLAVRNALHNKSYEVSKTVGGAFSRDEFTEVPEVGALLIGLRIGYDPRNHSVLQFFQGIYLTPDGQALGRPIGTLFGEPVVVKAKPGYAVGAINAHGGGGMDSLTLTFMKIVGQHLDPAVAYTADKVGGSGGGETIYDGKGVPIIGLCGRFDPSGKNPGFGVVFMVPVDPDERHDRRPRLEQ